MCENCWTRYYDSAQIDNERVREAAVAMTELAEHEPFMGCIHAQAYEWAIDEDCFESEGIDNHMCEDDNQRASEDKC